MASDPLTLGMQIRRARERKRLSQEELAALIDASPRAVGDWENDRRKPRNRLGALEEVLGVSFDGSAQQPPGISDELMAAIMDDPELTDEEKRNVIDAVRRQIATDRGWERSAAPPSAQRRRPAS